MRFRAAVGAAIGVLLSAAIISAQTAVVVRGKVSTVNASTAPLANAAVFTGAWEDARDYSTLTVSVFSDKSSAADGLEVQWSSDATNVDLADLYSITINVGRSWTTVCKGRYFRVKYTNGAVTQGAFRLSAILRQSGAPGYDAETGLTDTELRATAVPISGTVTANVGTGTQPVSGTVTANVGTGTQPVSGTFWQATQPISVASLPLPSTAATDRSTAAGPFSVRLSTGSAFYDTNTGAQLPAALDGSGFLKVHEQGTPTVTANAGTGTFTVGDGSGPLTVDGTVAATQSGTWTVQPGNTANTVAWKVDGSAVTQPVSGTITANAGTGTLAVSGPVTDTQLRATPVPVSGTVTANVGTGTQPVSGTVTANAGTGTMAVSGPVTDTQLRASAVPVSVAASVPGTSATNEGKAEDAVHGSGDTGVMALSVRNDGATVIAGSAGDYSPQAVDQYGAVYQAPHPGRFSCLVQAATVMTQCQAAPSAGLRAYVTGIYLTNQAASVQTVDVVFGTGSNCATVPTALTPKFQMGTNGTTTSPFMVSMTLPHPLVPTAANAICVRPSAATAFGALLVGYVAP